MTVTVIFQDGVFVPTEPVEVEPGTVFRCRFEHDETDKTETTPAMILEAASHDVQMGKTEPDEKPKSLLELHGLKLAGIPTPDFKTLEPEWDEYAP